MDDSSSNIQVLVDVARRLGETFELDALLSTVEQAGLKALGCERASVFLYDPAVEELCSRVATGGEVIRFSARKGIAGEAARTRGIILVPDAYADPRFNPEIDRQTGFRTRNLLTLPLIAPDGQVIGVLQALNKVDGQFSENDRVLAEALGALTGVAIKRQMLLDVAAAKQRMERDLNIAREIQQNTLPKAMPKVSGYEVGGWNLPADQTGGDCFDLYELPGGRLGFMIADATGHGIGPALIVSQCRAVLRALVQLTEDPSFVAERLNTLLSGDLPGGRFVTLCFGHLRPDEHVIEYVSAGHGPVLHFHAATGQVDSYGATGLPLGITADEQIPLAEPIVMAAGDLFVVITDGFLEWTDPTEDQYGEQRLIELIRNNWRLPCDQLIRAIYEAVIAFSRGTPQLDDLTVSIIRRCE